MPSLYGLLDTARSALLTHQMALNITGHNIANVSTEGYTRQRLQLGARPGSQQRPTGIGAGVEALALERLRVESYDRAYRRELSGLGQSQRREELLAAVEAVVGEPGDPGIGAALDAFFGAWADLGNEPAEESYRRAVLEAGDALAGRFNQLHGQLRDQRADINLEVERVAREVNELAARLAALNGQIQSAELNGQVAADLRDARDLVVDELARRVDISAAEDGTGVHRLWVGGRALVDGTHAAVVQTATRGDGDGSVLLDLRWADTGQAVDAGGGDLGGMLDVRDRVLPARLEELDALAGELARQVNLRHRGGSDLLGRAGRDFFDTTRPGAAGLALSRWVLDAPDRLAASADGGVGNGEQATAIASLAESTLAVLGGRTLAEAWGRLVTQVGAEAERCAAEREAQQSFVAELDARREAVGGVNLDEELAIMMEQEQAYAAAARVVGTADNLLQEILDLV